MKISIMFIDKGPFENESALVQVMAYRLFGNKPLPEAMLTQFMDAYMCHQVSVSQSASV